MRMIVLVHILFSIFVVALSVIDADTNVVIVLFSYIVKIASIKSRN